MSKTIDSLKRSSIKDEALYDRIAETYFYQKSHPKTRKKKIVPSIKNLKPFLLPASITLAVLAVLIYSLVFLESHRTDIIRKNISNYKVIKISSGGTVNRTIIKYAGFGGNAKAKSKFNRNAILLDNPKKYNWADLSFDFKFPIDFSKRNLSLWLKGDRGGEKIYIVLRDSNNRSCRFDDICLSSSWKDEVIPLDNIKKNIDLSNITHMRLECGYVGESPKEMDSDINMTIYIKDITISKEI